MIGTCLMGKYDIIDVIGHGGMGVVYKGRQVLMERTVAIKMLQSQHIADSQSVQRFLREGKASCRMNHPHVITVYDFGITPQSGQPFIVMDYLQGISLADLIKQDGQVSVERSIKILTQATDALDHAHRAGVIHRDLKPSNIMLIEYEDEKDFVKIVDFGVAQLIGAGGEQQRLTQMGEVCGSPVYMSPEQCQGLELDVRSDIYSMGIVIYETLTGRLPLIGKTMVETMSKHITDMPPRFTEIRPDLYIPERLEAVIWKAMAKDPANRHQSMAELCRDLDTAIPKPGKSQVLRTDFPTMPGEGEEKKERKVSPLIIGAVAAVVLLAAGVGGFMMLGKKQEAVTPPTNTITTTAPPLKSPAVVPPPGGTTPTAVSTPVVAPPVVPTPPVKPAPVAAVTSPAPAGVGKPDVKAAAPPVVKPVKKVRKPKPAIASSSSSGGGGSASVSTGGGGAIDRFKDLARRKSF